MGRYGLETQCCFDWIVVEQAERNSIMRDVHKHHAMSEPDTEDVLYEAKEIRSRNGLAAFFQRLSRRLGRGEPVPVDEGQTVTVSPPEESELEVEIEREGNQLRLEIELEWEGGENDVETEVVASKATFEVYEDNAGQWRWRLVHRNGNIIADGSEGYASKQKVKQGLGSVKKNVAGANVADQSRDEPVETDAAGSDATAELFADNQGKWRWRLVHDNGNIIADSGQGYASKQKAKQGLQSVKTNAPGAPVEED